MKLTKDQIDHLFSFTAKKYVHYYDLQIELVDHLAERIEEAITLQPLLTFENALQKVYYDFGIFGFSTIVREKERQVYRRGEKLFWRECRNLFTWPKIFSVITIALAIWQITQLVHLDILLPIVFGLWVTVNIFLFRKERKILRRYKKKLLILTYNPEGGIMPFVLFQALVFVPGYQWHPLAFCVIVLSGILMNLASWQVFRNLLHEARSLYPAAFA